MGFKTVKGLLESKLVKDIENCFLKITDITGDDAIITDYVNLNLNM